MLHVISSVGFYRDEGNTGCVEIASLDLAVDEHGIGVALIKVGDGSDSLLFWIDRYTSRGRLGPGDGNRMTLVPKEDNRISGVLLQLTTLGHDQVTISILFIDGDSERNATVAIIGQTRISCSQVGDGQLTGLIDWPTVSLYTIGEGKTTLGDGFIQRLHSGRDELRDIEIGHECSCLAFQNVLFHGHDLQHYRLGAEDTIAHPPYLTSIARPTDNSPAKSSDLSILIAATVSL